jgi:2-polyprenyl-3-methyl-5-hydroxy-6-metoxy-1,4-benzoquinol methylase
MATSARAQSYVRRRQVGWLRTLARRWRRQIRALISPPGEPAFDPASVSPTLAPVERHIALSALAAGRGLFDKSYDLWRVRRIDKMLEIYGIDHFNGLRVLELGCGHGEIGAFLAQLGADVLSVDGRIHNINHARLKYRHLDRLRFALLNLEEDFEALGRFDLIVNFGLIYHLKGVDRHLRRCFRMSDDILLESVVCDSLDPWTILYREEDPRIDEESLLGIGSRPSPAYIERLARDAGFWIDRHFTADLNVPPQFCYDWEHRDDGAPNDDFVKRRFWRLRRGGGPAGGTA